MNLMLGPSLFGFQSTAVIDLVVLSLLLVVPALAYAVRLARSGRYSSHRNVQLGLFWVLCVAVTAFEADLRSSGGIWELTKFSRFAGTAFLRWTVYIHNLFSFSSAALWIGLTATSVFKFGKNPKPNQFSRQHRFIGWIALWDLVLTGVTGVFLYLVSFTV